jgi:nuclear receptor coactivator 2
MSDISNGEAGSSANNNDPESNQNKKDSEKKRREQENICIEELAMLISAQLPEFSDSDESSGANDPSKLEKGSILQETVEKLKKLKAGNQAHSKEIQREEISSSQSVLPKEILGSLVLEALDGFMFIVSNDGKIDFVSDNVFDYLGFKQDSLTEQVIYNFIHHGDHARFSVNLEPESWRTWKRLPTNAAVTQGFDRSKVFNLRFLVNNVAKQESMEDHQQRVDQYENMQVSAIVMLNPIEDKGEDPKSGLFCIARRITHNERSGLTPVEQFTTKSSRQTFKIETVDTEGLPELYRKNISGHALGKTLVDLVHPHDKPLIKEHI